MVTRGASRPVMAVLATVALLVLGGGCTPSAPTREPPAGTPAAVDPPPDGMLEINAGFYFAFAVPEEWEHCPGNECYGPDRATTWGHGDGRLVVPRVSSGGACPAADDRSTMALNSDASRHLPDAYDSDGERSLRVEVPIVGSRELAVPNAAGAWQHEIVDRDGGRHLVNKVHLSGQALTMYFLHLEEEAVAQVTDTVAAAILESPWTPPDGYCSDRDA